MTYLASVGRRSAGKIVLMVILASSSVPLLRAQSSGTISGTIRDISGAVMPGVEVVVRNVETAFSRTVVTNDAGRFSVLQLPLGEYEVQGTLSGFKTELRRGIILTVGREAVVDMAMSVGEVTERVEVTGEAPLIETTQSSVASLVSDQQVRDLPLNGRSMEQLAVLQLGVNISRNTSAGGYFQGFTSRINIGGARATASSFLLDGTDINDSSNNSPGDVAGVQLGVDTIREFKVLVNNYTAEYGRSAGGVVMSVSRSGTNQFHGSAFEFLRNSSLDARDFFDRNPRNPTVRSNPPPFRRNQFGGTLGGPILQDRLFFFGGYEGLRSSRTTTAFPVVPTVAARNGDLPSGHVDVLPAIQPYLALEPLPTPGGQDFGDGTAEYVTTQTDHRGADNFMTRIDQTISSQDSLFGRYTFDRANQRTPNAIATLMNPFHSRIQYATIEETHIFSPSWLNVARIGLNRSILEDQCLQLVDMPSSLDLVPGRRFATSGGITPGSSIGGLSQCGTSPRKDAYTLLEGSEDMTFVRTTHALRFGTIAKNMRYNKRAERNQAGTYSFDNIRNFLLGQATTFNVQVPLDADVRRSWRQTLYGFFVQDEWKATSRLTLNLGLRYEFVTAPVEVHGRASSLLNVAVDPAYTVFGKEPFLPNLSKKNFTPRVGFAYDLTGGGKTAIRGGFGLFYNQILFETYHISGLRNPPFTFEGIVNNPPPSSFPRAYQLLISNPGVGTSQQNNFNPTHTPSSMQYNFGIQHQLWRDILLNLQYLGSQGRHLIATRDLNGALPTILTDGQYFFPVGARRRNPNFGSVLTYTTSANSSYNALGIGISRRAPRGVQYQVNYTWSKLMDSASQQYAPESDNGTRPPQNADNPGADRSVSTQNLAHNFVASTSYELPFGANRSGWVGQLIKGWQLNGILSLNGGVPLSIEGAFSRARNALDTSAYQPRPNIVAGKSINPTSGVSAGCGGPTGTAPGTKIGTPDKFLDPCVFEWQPAGYYGNLGRNTAVGPSLANLDFSTTKQIATPMEGMHLEFRAELFNVLNHANFGTPTRTIFNNATGCPADGICSVRPFDPQQGTVGVVPNGNFGVIRSSRTTSRQIQFALKLLF